MFKNSNTHVHETHCCLGLQNVCLLIYFPESFCKMGNAVV